MSIHKAETLPASFYTGDLASFNPDSWQFLGHKKQFEAKATPVVIDSKALLLSQNGGNFHLLPNVCTHRAAKLLSEPTTSPKIVCPYHGRRFNLEGKMEFMPGFEEAENFPRDCDHLKQLPLQQWNNFLFGSLKQQATFDFSLIDERVSFLPLEQLTFLPKYSKQHQINAHWALYVDNYLEGFHIPFVHNDLNEALDWAAYTTICKDQVVLQIGYADQGTKTFNLPEGHIDFEKDIAAYYYWLWPNTMLNFYPWGVSVNVVKPVRKDFTQIDFYTYVFNKEQYVAENRFDEIDKVEKEDEDIVEQVQKGIESGFYTTGRYSPKHEKGVYHFHQLIKENIDW